MGKILDNPKEYFDSLSDEEFKNLLDEFGFEYEDMSHLSKEGQEEYNQILNNIFKDTNIQLFDFIKGDNTIYIIPKVDKPIEIVFGNYERERKELLNEIKQIQEDVFKQYEDLELELGDKSIHKKKNKKVKNWERTKFYQR